MRLYQCNPDGTVQESKFTTVYQARKAIKDGAILYPSVTTVAKAFTSPILTAWKENQMLEAAYYCAESAVAGMEKKEWAALVQSRMEDQNKAAAWGTGFHACTETGIWPEQYLPWKPVWEKFRDEEIGEVIAQEIPVADHALRVAGRLDLHYRRKCDGTEAILDYKSGGWKKGKPTYYLSWPWQLATYANAIQKKNGGALPKIMSVPVCRDEPAITSRLWTDEEQYEAYEEFRVICNLWHRDNLLYAD